MKIYVKNTQSGLIPMDSDDYDLKKRLKIGEVYSVDVKLVRNYQFHKKYFALINCAWEYLTEKQQTFFKTIENFRKTIEVAAGHCEPFYSHDRKEWFDIPKSIAFDKMDNKSFEDLYSRVLDVLFLTALKTISREEFEENLINFL